MITRDELLTVLAEFNAQSERLEVSQESIEQRFLEIERTVPHASLLELMFWPEIERDAEEIADEALFREHLWLEGGEMALLRHIRSQMQRAISDPAVRGVYRRCALETLDRVEEEIEKIEGQSVH